MSVSRKNKKRVERRRKTSKKKEKKRAKAFETRIFYARWKQKIHAPEETEENKKKMIGFKI